jgi:protein-S-isoprenylcysteine O-methyltransferase Ste14
MAKAKKDSGWPKGSRVARVTAKAAVVAMPIILLIVGGVFVVSYFACAFFGAGSLGFPLVVRTCGVALVVAGLAFAGWAFRHRSPATMIVSTYTTFTKMLGRTPMSERSARSEPLVVVGPQKYTRNPLYFGVILLVFGWGLYSAASYILVAALLLVLWFRLVLIPFEEKELLALFGGQYVKYSEEVPMLVPFTKRKR